MDKKDTLTKRPSLQVVVGAILAFVLVGVFLAVSPPFTGHVVGGFSFEAAPAGGFVRTATDLRNLALPASQQQQQVAPEGGEVPPPPTNTPEAAEWDYPACITDDEYCVKQHTDAGMDPNEAAQLCECQNTLPPNPCMRMVPLQDCDENGCHQVGCEAHEIPDCILCYNDATVCEDGKPGTYDICLGRDVGKCINPYKYLCTQTTKDLPLRQGGCDDDNPHTLHTCEFGHCKYQWV